MFGVKKKQWGLEVRWQNLKGANNTFPVSKTSWWCSINYFLKGQNTAQMLNKGIQICKRKHDSSSYDWHIAAWENKFDSIRIFSSWCIFCG